MGVPTSKVGYTSAMSRREDHEVHKDMWGHWGEGKKNICRTVHHCYSWKKRPTWCHLLFLFHFLCAQHVSDINISIIRSLRLFCWITTLVMCSWFDACWSFGLVGLEWYPCCRFSLQHGYHPNPTTPKLQHTSNQEQYDQCGNSTE